MITKYSELSDRLSRRNAAVIRTSELGNGQLDSIEYVANSASLGPLLVYSFVGLFADPVVGLPQRIAAAWSDVSPITIDKPISAIGVRFGEHHYDPSLEGTPLSVVGAVEELSRQSPGRFMLLRTECWGGDGALRRLIQHWGVDLGPSEIFAPLQRDFP
ncbi:hypothetical protein [Bradyrhizobium sp. C9]|uniref:hypothetical protein n=1 Tax=Bradyrhizobium sp. C9 TaxID=142585 RepID=UPI000BE80CBD|nr:hypothetical protein [Bradyrhizobium sp. C9]PDT74933.1 hypothetical protein CO675_21690 [Bradyrhizobium sp. C9]